MDTVYTVYMEEQLVLPDSLSAQLRVVSNGLFCFVLFDILTAATFYAYFNQVSRMPRKLQTVILSSVYCHNKYGNNNNNYCHTFV